jgi:hypothetical protein
MPERSLLTDDVRALIGQPTPLGSVEVTQRALSRAAQVLGANPGIIPPGERVPGYALLSLGADYETPALPILLPNSLIISTEWEYERPLRMGERLEAAYSIVSINERFGGRFGYSIDFRSQTEFRDAEGNVAARSVNTMTQYSAADSRAGGTE